MIDDWLVYTVCSKKRPPFHFYRGTSHGPVSICPSICLSVTSRCSTKTAKRRITQTTPHDSPRTLVFWSQRSLRNWLGSPLAGRQMQVGWVKIGDFRQITSYITKMVQDRCAVSVKVEQEFEWWHCRWPWVTHKLPKLPQFVHFAPLTAKARDFKFHILVGCMKY